MTVGELLEGAVPGDKFKHGRVLSLPGDAGVVDWEVVSMTPESVVATGTVYGVSIGQQEIKLSEVVVS